MKRSIITLTCLLGTTFLLMGADFITKTPGSSGERKMCFGYRIIEAGKGVDCNGDTIRLVKRSGFYERIQNGTSDANE